MSRILLTGAGQRIGHAMAEALAAEGHELCLHFNRSRTATEALAARIEAAGGRAVALRADLENPVAAAELVERAQEALGPLDLLINNASIYEPDQLETFTAASWDRSLAVNLRAPALLCQAFHRFLAPGTTGSIINLLDTRVAAPIAGDFLSYTVSKAALAALTRMLAVELAPRVRVNAIAPGLTLPSNGQTQEEFESAQAAAPLGLGAGLDDVLRALRYLMEAVPVTGQILYVDGGERFLGRPLDS